MNERYLFRGKRFDNGEWVTGYYYCDEEANYCCIMYINGEYIEKPQVDPDTVEPVAAKIIPPKDPKDWWLGYKCPNCKKNIKIERKYKLINNTAPKYCEECGQRLDWNVKEG